MVFYKFLRYKFGKLITNYELRIKNYDLRFTKPFADQNQYSIITANCQLPTGGLMKTPKLIVRVTEVSLRLRQVLSHASHSDIECSTNMARGRRDDFYTPIPLDQPAWASYRLTITPPVTYKLRRKLPTANCKLPTANCHLRPHLVRCVVYRC